MIECRDDRKEVVNIVSDYKIFRRTVQNLEDIYKYESPYETVVLMGMVKLYEICFEQSWKAIKEVLEYHGSTEGASGSPRQILKTAYSMGMIEDETLWLDALVSRNNVSHAYNQAIALEIVEKTKTSYYNMFCTLQQEIETNWNIQE